MQLLPLPGSPFHFVRRPRNRRQLIPLVGVTRAGSSYMGEGNSMTEFAIQSGGGDVCGPKHVAIRVG